MKNWLLGILMLFGVAGVWAGQPPDHKIVSGDTLGKIAKQNGYDYKVLCAFNGLANCNVIKKDEWIKFPARGTTQAKPAELSCITLGAAPFNPGHNLTRTLEGIDLLKTLTPAQKEIAKRKVALGEKATGQELVGQQIFKEMLYQSKYGKKEVVHVYDKPICTPEQGGQPEIMDTYDLGGGVFLSIPRRCGNPSVFIKPVTRKPEPKEEPREEPKEVPKEDPPEEETKPDPKEVPPKEAVHRWDWELVVGQEHDRTSHSTFGSGAIYGLIVEGAGAEHAFGIGGTYSTWHGKTDTGFGFNGHLGGYGPAYKYSAYEGGYDFGLKLLPWATLEENGDQGQYKSQRQFDLRGVTLAYNNYARELKGEKSFFKYQLFLSVFKPTGGGGEHSWEGKQLETADISKLDHVVNAGARVGLYDFSEEDDKIGAKLWASLGWFQEAPSLAETGNWRLQLSDKHERFFIGFGRNYDLLNGGSITGFGWSWDIRKTVYVHREETRKAQFIAKIEQAGGRLDKDGMVILPKGTDSPFKQWKAAPSDADD